MPTSGQPDAFALPTGFNGSSDIETNGIFANNDNSYAPLVSSPHGSFGFTSFPVFNFDSGSSAFPSNPSTVDVDSVRLSIYNTATLHRLRRG